MRYNNVRDALHMPQVVILSILMKFIS